MPHGHLSYLQTFPQRVVKSQEKEIPWFSVSGTAFAFQLAEITFLQGGIAAGNQKFKMFVTSYYTRILRRGRGGSGGWFSSRTRVGEEARRVLKGYSRKVEKKVLEKTRERRAALDGTIECGNCFIAEKAEAVETATKTSMGGSGVKCLM